MARDQIRCRLSDPCQPHFLSERYGVPPSDCFTCGQRNFEHNIPHFYCEACDVHFHVVSCYMFPRKVRHPYHPQHPLSFIFVNRFGAVVPYGKMVDYWSKRESGGHEHDSVTGHGKCDWCEAGLETNCFYRCSVCGFSLCLGCLKLDPPLNKANPRNHEHDLFLLPRPLRTPCDACGWVDASDPSYACLQCNYVVHRRCVDLPRLIKIAYHRHRLSHTTHLPPGKWSCGICHKQVDHKYGAYHCKDGCTSFFHSKCATREVIWDEKELEWEPEEPDETKDPFEKVGEKEILHFMHEHHLRLNEGGGVRDTDKRCQACVLPVDSGDFYHCMQCEFFLHIACASLPRKKYHELHCHRLILCPILPEDLLWCVICNRKYTGFQYKCNECDEEVRIDVRCASVSSPLNHKSHLHLLYFFDEDITSGLKCEGCHQELAYRDRLECIDGSCRFALCFRCTTFPDEVRYKDDEHPLTLCCGEESKEKYWCEVCEREFNSKDEWLYACDKCSVTLHVDCAFGSFVHVKHGDRFKMDENELQMVRNNSSSRPVCSVCGQHCRDTVFLKTKIKDTPKFMCSFECSYNLNMNEE